MKAYGMTRHDKISCKYGCCTLMKGASLVSTVRRARKAARRLDVAATREEG